MMAETNMEISARDHIAVSPSGADAGWHISISGGHGMIDTMSADSQLAQDRQRVPEAVTPEQRAWLERSEALWKRAHDLARRHPESDVTDLYHALRCLQLTPTRRLAAGLRRGRLRAHTR
jgi:hypothetical protein